MKSILAFASVALVAALFFVAPELGLIVVGLAMLIFAPEIVIGARAVLAGLRTREARIVGAIAGVSATISAALVFSVGAAFAADAVAPAVSSVTIPWGDWLGSLLAGAATLFVAFLTRVVAMAPAAVRTFVTNDVIEKAVDYAIATTRDAARGREATIEVSNQLIAVALRWIVDNEPKIAGWANDKLGPLIAARLSALNVIPPEATSKTLAIASPASGA